MPVIKPKTIRQHLKEKKPDFFSPPEAARHKANQDFIAEMTQETDQAVRVRIAKDKIAASNFQTLRPLLPLVFSLKGKPYSLERYFPFEPFFHTNIPRMSMFKTGRQVSKSTSLAAQGVLTSVTIPHFSTLYVTPLFEMIRRFSHNYVRRFIEESPVRGLFVDSKCINSVMQRSFRNSSQMIFSFAYLDAERTRGISADRNTVDEIQDINYDFLSIIHETMSGSEKYGIIQYAGTPKSVDNTIEKLWRDSSQAEWAIRCHYQGCGHWNVPAVYADLIAMIGPPRDDISINRPAVVCAKCQKPIDPLRHGRWIHQVKENRHEFVGRHIPQIIMPMHYSNPEKWRILYGKMQGKFNTPYNVFMNEVCGESFDTGSKLVTQTDLRKAACLPWDNKANEVMPYLDNYVHRVCAVDWGGGGEKMTSFTVVVVLGITPDGRIDVLWAHRVLRMLDYEYEARVILSALRQFQCSHLAHDYGTSGGGREALLVQAGFPITNIFPIRYRGNASQEMIQYRPPTTAHPRHWYSVDRSRSLITVCMAIRYGLMLFFRYDYKGIEDPGLLHDFLALQEEKTDSRLGSDLYTIVRNPEFADDFAHAVNYGACCLWHMAGKFPSFAEQLRFQVPPDMYQFVTPARADDLDLL